MWAVHLPLVLTKGRMKLTNRSLLIIIMIVAAVLRFYNYFEIPFTHDEFSALFRTNFPDFQTLIDQGVKVDVIQRVSKFSFITGCNYLVSMNGQLNYHSHLWGLLLFI